MEPAFVPNNYEYSITVPNKLETTEDLIKYELVDSNATVKVDEVTELKVGENIINVIVTNATGDNVVTYKLKITRLSDDDIDVTHYLNNKVTFTNGNGEEKTLSFVDFELQYPEEAKKIEDGTFEFDDNGKRILEEITTEEKDTKKSNKIVLIIVLTVVGLGIIIVSGILIFRKKKPKKEKAENIEEKNEEILEEVKENDVNEEGIEESVIGENFSKDKDATIDIDQALNDLMNTKQYDLNSKDDE